MEVEALLEKVNALVAQSGLKRQMEAGKGVGSPLLLGLGLKLKVK